MGGAPLERWSPAARAWIEAAFSPLAAEVTESFWVLSMHCSVHVVIQTFLQNLLYLRGSFGLFQLKASTPLQSHTYSL